MEDFVSRLLALDLNAWFWVVVIPMIIMALIKGPGSGGGNDGGGSSSFGGGDCD